MTIYTNRVEKKGKDEMVEGNGDRVTKVTIDVGTAYDFLTSLHVLLAPKKFGVRGSWASGMLARLSAESRDVLSRTAQWMSSPVHLIPTYPEPRNAETFLWQLAQRDPIDRLRDLLFSWHMCEGDFTSILAEVSARGRWTEDDRRRLATAYREVMPEKTVREEVLTETLDAWADAEALSEAYLATLKNYYDVFFREEEGRILPAIEAAGKRIAGLVQTLELPDLIEEISSGLRFEDLPSAQEYVLAPSYWVTPLFMRTRIDADRILFVFGARPASDSIVPGETVPEGLVRALKGLSDPTRLKILRLVAKQPMGAAELARSLRLRTPTVLHHIHGLRLSGLLQIRMPDAGAKQRSLFALRPAGVRTVMTMLDTFLDASERIGERDDDSADTKDG